MNQPPKYGFIETNRLENLIKNKGILISAQCDDMGISRSTMYHLRNGHRMPNTYTLAVMSDYYGVSVDYLLGRS